MIREMGYREGEERGRGLERERKRMVKVREEEGKRGRMEMIRDMRYRRGKKREEEGKC